MKRAAIILFALAVAFPALASVGAPGEFDLGFIASRHRDLHGDLRTKALGPFLEWASNDKGMSLTAVRPLYARVSSEAQDKMYRYCAWPVYASVTLKTEAQWRFLLWYGFDHDYPEKPHRHRLWLFPFYYQGRDLHGETYHAVFPFWGSIHEVLGRDEINLYMFPIHSTSRLNDLRTSNWLWPFISKTTGDKVYRARFFPFYGVSKWEGKYEKHFVLWPFWNSVKYDYPTSKGKGFILFPVCGYMSLTDEKTLWILPPIFRFTKGAKMDKVFCPWPFFQWTRGTIDKLYIWPLYGHKRIEHLDNTFVFWPIFWHEIFDKNTTTRYRTMAVPIYFSETEVTNPTNGTPRTVVSKYRKVWPLFSYKRVGDESRFRMLELWPFVESPPIEYNWAPLWTLYSRVSKGTNRDVELLWGLYRSRTRGPDRFASSLFPLYDWERDTAADHLRSWSLLKGLIGYERQGTRRTLRLLYFIRFGGKGERP